MAITYPLNIPTNVSFERLNFSSNQSVSFNRSPFTLDTQVQEHQGQAWVVEATLPTMERSNAEAWVTFLMKLNGVKGTFLLGDPLGAEPRGSVAGTPVVNGGSQTGQSLVTDGWTPGATGVLLAGDYIQLGQRLYKVLSDVNADGSGNATLDIWPRLRESPADNDTIITDSPVGLFRLATAADVNLWNSDKNQVYDISFVALEAL